MPDRMSEDMPDRMLEKMSEDMPDRMSDRMPEDMPEDLPDRMPENMPEHMPENMPDRMPEDMSDRMPEDMPEDMPEHMPENMPDRMPDRMPEDMSDRMPEDLPVRKCINVVVRIIRSEVIPFVLNVLRKTISSYRSLVICIYYFWFLAHIFKCFHGCSNYFRWMPFFLQLEEQQHTYSTHLLQLILLRHVRWLCGATTEFYPGVFPLNSAFFLQICSTSSVVLLLSFFHASCTVVFFWPNPVLYQLYQHIWKIVCVFWIPLTTFENKSSIFIIHNYLCYHYLSLRPYVHHYFPCRQFFRTQYLIKYDKTGYANLFLSQTLQA